MTNNQTKLQSIIDIASYYGKMYRISYGVIKTKVTVYGPKVDRDYYSELKPWIMNNEQIEVSVDNEHLGQIISGEDEEIKMWT